MIRGELLHWDERCIRLPNAVEWRLQYGRGTSCNSFQLICLWELDNGNDLAEAVNFTAEENGERLFTGVVDECERGWDTAGGTLIVAGRGMAARLLDNKALGVDYQVATAEDILRDHVAPYDIEAVRGVGLLSVPGFSVDAGSSEQQVVYEFCRCYGRIAPRFDRLGRLVLAPWEEGRRPVLGVDAAVTSFRLREQRYGVLPEVLVQDRITEKVQRVADEDFLRRGGRRRRVLTMPGKSSYQAMRHSGVYQLARAREELRQTELELPKASATQPGELVELDLARSTGWSLWQVRGSVYGLTVAGTYTRLTLGEPQRRSGFMWISEQGRRRTKPDGIALVGQVTLSGGPAGVYLAGGRWELPVFGPDGYVWRPKEGEQVLVLKTGQAGEAPCMAGWACEQGQSPAAGEVLIYSGSASTRIDGEDIQLTGDMLVNGKPVLTREG